MAAACEELGWHLREGPHKWYGRWIDDSPVPKELFPEKEYDKILKMSKEKRREFMTKFLNATHFAIAVPDQDYEIGLVDCGDHYKLAWDFWRGKLDFNPLLQKYGVHATVNSARLQGHVCSQHVTEDGSVQIRCEVGEYTPW